MQPRQPGGLFFADVAPPEDGYVIIERGPDDRFVVNFTRAHVEDPRFNESLGPFPTWEAAERAARQRFSDQLGPLETCGTAGDCHLLARKKHGDRHPSPSQVQAGPRRDQRLFPCPVECQSHQAGHSASYDARRFPMTDLLHIAERIARSEGLPLGQLTREERRRLIQVSATKKTPLRRTPYRLDAYRWLRDQVAAEMPEAIRADRRGCAGVSAPGPGARRR